MHTRRTTRAQGRTTVNVKETGRAGYARLPLCAVAPVPPRCGEYALTPRRCVAAAQRSESTEEGDEILMSVPRTDPIPSQKSDH